DDDDDEWDNRMYYMNYSATVFESVTYLRLRLWTMANHNHKQLNVRMGGALLLENIKNAKLTRATDGGGALAVISSSSVVIQSSRFENCYSADGGAIYFANTPETSWHTIIQTKIINSVFNNNTAEFEGGVIRFNEGSFSITNCTFSNSHAKMGGVLSLNDINYALIDNSVFVNNTALTSGGVIMELGVLNSNSMKRNFSTVVRNSIFNYNRAFLSGGVMFLASQSWLIENSSFTGNRADVFGGVIFLPADKSSIHIMSSSFTANKANMDGGCFYLTGFVINVFFHLSVIKYKQHNTIQI
ncbi:adhesin-like protein, partial [Reticulomyxa filosa]